MNDDFRKRAALEQYESICGEIRHEFDDKARPAIRVALGAYAIGDMSFDDLKNCLQTCSTTSAITEVSWDNVDKLADYQSRIAYSPAPSSSLKLDTQERKILLIEDDPIVQHCWSVVLGAIFLGWKNRATVQVGEYHREVCLASHYQITTDMADLVHAEMVLLDYRLANGELGGDLIKTLKDQLLTLPIVIFTASDSAMIAKWCLTHGASDYFVKELTEKEDRESIAYYERLKQVLVSALMVDNAIPRSTVSRIWNEYLLYRPIIAGLDRYYDRAVASSDREPWKSARLQAECNSNARTHRRTLFHLDWCIRQAFRFLLEAQHWTASVLFTDNDERYDLLSCSTLLDASCEILAEIGRIIATGFDGIPKFYGIDDKLHEKIALLDRWGFVLESPLALPGGFHHAGHVNLKLPEPPTLSATISHFETVIALIRSVSRIVESARANPIELAMPTTLPPQPYITTTAASHGTLSHLGAIDFVEEAYRSIVGPFTPKDDDKDTIPYRLARLHSSAPWNNLSIGERSRNVLLLDDQKERDTPWLQALSTMKVQYKIRSTQFQADALKVVAENPQLLKDKGKFSATTLRKYDLILLDLDIYERHAGLQWLDDIKVLAPEVPVVILTGSDDSFGVREAFRRGAADYFLKRKRPDDMVVDSNTALTRYDELRLILHGLLQNHAIESPMRAVGYRLHEFCNSVAVSFDEQSAKTIYCAFHPDARYAEYTDSVKMSYYWRIALIRHLIAAWGYVLRAEVRARPQLLNGVCLEGWLADALSGGTDQLGAVASWAYVECGCVVELLANTYQGLQALPFDPETRPLILRLQKRLKSLQLPTADNLWTYRNDAIHAKLPAEFLSLPSLCSALSATLCLSHTFISELM